MSVPSKGFDLFTSDCLRKLRLLPTDSVDLIFCSPPYEAARSYGGLKARRGQEWVDWAATIYLECQRVSRGLVAWVIEGQTEQFRYSCTPQLLQADLHRAGVKFRKPPAYYRFGTMGSGGPDWLRNDYEIVLCSSKGRLPWSDNVACGHPPKYAPGGNPSCRTANDSRCRSRKYKPPKLANPGNVIRCTVGGGHMGHDLAHENEAPFPLELAEFFVKSFCPPGGIVLDIFSGSGTTGHAALLHGRRYIGIDCRESQTKLARRRLNDVAKSLRSVVRVSSSVP